MIGSGAVLPGAAALVSAGMATTIAGILAPALFLPGVIIIGTGLLAAAAGGVLSLFEPEAQPTGTDAAASR